MSGLREIWEETSFQLEKMQSNPDTAIRERKYLKEAKGVTWRVDFDYGLLTKAIDETPSVAILREEGSNGDREMAAAFYIAGFRVFDVCMEDLLEGRRSLSDFRGIAFVGGFSYADVLGSAKGWASCILFHEKLKAEFEYFYNRSDTFSFGVCNGCQLMTLLAWVGNTNADKNATSCGIFLDQNASGRFESRFSSVRIEKSPAVMLKGMEGSVLGVWVSHGEGKFTYKNDSISQKLQNEHLVSMRYVDEEWQSTERYPLNPNGSVDGIAGVCSSDGRHLALMPHPERCFLTWQWPFWPQKTLGAPKTDMKSPWIRIFENAFEFCIN